MFVGLQGPPSLRWQLQGQPPVGGSAAAGPAGQLLLWQLPRAWLQLLVLHLVQFLQQQLLLLLQLLQLLLEL